MSVVAESETSHEWRDHTSTFPSSSTDVSNNSASTAPSKARPSALNLGNGRRLSNNSMAPTSGDFSARSHNWLDDMLASNLETPERLYFDSQFISAPMSARSLTGFQIPELNAGTITEISSGLNSPAGSPTGSPTGSLLEAEDEDSLSFALDYSLCGTPPLRATSAQLSYSRERGLDADAGLRISTSRNLEIEELTEGILIDSEATILARNEDEQQFDLASLNSLPEQTFESDSNELAYTMLETSTDLLESGIESIYTNDTLLTDGGLESFVPKNVSPSQLSRSSSELPPAHWEVSNPLTDSEIVPPNETSHTGCAPESRILAIDTIGGDSTSYEPLHPGHRNALTISRCVSNGAHLPLPHPIPPISLNRHPAYGSNDLPAYDPSLSRGHQYTTPQSRAALMPGDIGHAHTMGTRSAGNPIERPALNPPFEAPRTPVLQIGASTGGGIMTPQSTPYGSRTAHHFTLGSTEVLIDSFTGRICHLESRSSVSSKAGPQKLKRVTVTRGTPQTPHLIQRNTEIFLRNVIWFELFPLVPGWMVDGPEDQLFLIYAGDKLALPAGSVPTKSLVEELAKRPDLFHQKRKRSSAGLIKCRCNGCSFGSTDYKDLAEHCDQNHSETVSPSSYLYCFDEECPFSIFGFTSLTNYRRHLKCSHDIEISDHSKTLCKKCYREFGRPDLFWKHFWVCRESEYTGVKPAPITAIKYRAAPKSKKVTPKTNGRPKGKGVAKKAKCATKKSKAVTKSPKLSSDT